MIEIMMKNQHFQLGFSHYRVLLTTCPRKLISIDMDIASNGPNSERNGENPFSLMKKHKEQLRQQRAVKRGRAQRFHRNRRGSAHKIFLKLRDLNAHFERLSGVDVELCYLCNGNALVKASGQRGTS